MSGVFGLALLSGVPTWLLAGLFLGALFAVLILGAFLAGERLFPSRRRETDDRVRGERLRREEIRYYLQAIDEPFEEDAAAEGREVAFLLSDRDVAVTFDARTYLLLRESPVHPILVEHEMPGVALGTRLPFETPDVGFERDADADGVDATTGSRGGRGPAFDDAHWGADRPGAGDAEAVGPAYAVLGLPPDADGETVRSAYRERVKEVHPDHGGDEEAFKRLQDAYATVREHADNGEVSADGHAQRSEETS